MDKVMSVNDRYNNLSDNINVTSNGTVQLKHSSPYTRTQIIAYDDFGDVLFETENQIVLGGALFTLEKVFGVTSPLKVEYLNDIKGIANTCQQVTEIYPKDNVVCLFGVGIGGCGDSYKSVKDVKFYEREIEEMIPFRLVSGQLPQNIRDKYFFKGTYQGKNAYYLKKFEQDPKIKVLWKDAAGDADGTEVQNNVHTTQRTEAIETFVEITLRIDKDDIREYFETNGGIEQARINSIALFTGVKAQLADGTVDYKQVKMFSKLNIPNEMLNVTKSFTMVYRIYAS